MTGWNWLNTNQLESFGLTLLDTSPSAVIDWPLLGTSPLEELSGPPQLSLMCQLDTTDWHLQETSPLDMTDWHLLGMSPLEATGLQHRKPWTLTRKTAPA